jgi:hypothetical protein
MTVLKSIPYAAPYLPPAKATLATVEMKFILHWPQRRK